ncbi:MAG: hypothetical protein NC342_07300 [Pseudoflavonifractor sp.]|nr:hypothetical protein [Alloprevotella sp.]MCM1117324.1 hypothetical protein [Pseudoflavonifractor sp.]
MTYDIYAGASNSSSHHTGRNISEKYRLADHLGSQRIITRDESVDLAYVKRNTFPITFRSTYSNDKIQLVNTVGFTHSSAPENSYSGSLRYSDDPSRDYSYSNSNPWRSNSLSYSGYFYKPLPMGMDISITPSLRYTHRNDLTLYSTINDPTMINRKAFENATSYSIDFGLSKQWGNRHSGMLSGGSYGNFSSLNYSGSDFMNSSYSYLPSNSLYFSGQVANYQQFRSRKIIYTPYDNGQALLRSTLNNGKFYRTNISLNATLKLFDGKLQLNVGPRQTFYNHTGIYDRSYNAFSCSGGANLYLGHWYFNVYYYSPEKKMDEVDNSIIRPRNLYWLTAGWGNGSWNLRFSAYNIFNRGWDLYTETYTSEYYSYRSVGDDTYYHPRLNFAVTYTIGYGKKVRRGNEVGQQGEASSAILK